MFHRLAANIEHRFHRHIQRFSDLRIGPRWTRILLICLEQNSSASKLQCRRFTSLQQCLTLATFLLCQTNNKDLLHAPSLELWYDQVHPIAKPYCQSQHSLTQSGQTASLPGTTLSQFLVWKVWQARKPAPRHLPHDHKKQNVVTHVRTGIGNDPRTCPFAGG